MSIRRITFAKMGMAALALSCIMMMALTGCDTGNGGGGPGPGETFPAAKGKLTITGIPAEHNGKYIWLSGTAGMGTFLYGLSDITGYPDSIAYKMIQIADGKAAVPLYTAAAYLSRPPAAAAVPQPPTPNMRGRQPRMISPVGPS